MDNRDNRSFGVFKPVGHLVVSLPSAGQADQAEQALRGLGVPDQAVRRLSDTEMLAQIEQDLLHASPLAALGQELNLIKAHREMARRGYHWLVIHVDDDTHAERIAATLSGCGAQTAQLYGHFIIQELIGPPGGRPQISESPDRGLDAPSLDAKAG